MRGRADRAGSASKLTPGPRGPKSGISRALVSIALVGAMVFATSCRSGSSDTASRPQLQIELRDFALRVDRVRLVAGPTELAIENIGPTVHELVIARTRLPIDELPMDTSGIRLDEQSSTMHSIVDISNVHFDESRRRVVNFAPGHYVVFCNLPGHFLGRMYAEFTVTAGVQSS